MYISAKSATYVDLSFTFGGLSRISQMIERGHADDARESEVTGRESKGREAEASGRKREAEETVDQRNQRRKRRV